MTPFIVDSSVVIKWFVPESLSAEAVRVRDGGTPSPEKEIVAMLWETAV